MFKKEKKIVVKEVFDKKIKEKKEVSRKEIDADHVEIIYDDGSKQVVLV